MRLTLRNASSASLAAILLGGLLAAAAPASTPSDPVVTTAEPVTTGGPPGLRRLNEAQYVRSIEQIFGPRIEVPGRFEPPLRADGLLAIGDGRVAVSPSGLEQYELRSREIAAQVLAPGRRTGAMPCTPSAPTGFDRDCAAAFLGKYGRLLYRRPLSDKELASVTALAGAAARSSGDFYKGLEIGLSRLLSSPKFIFRVEASEPDPSHPGALRLDDYALASRISFLLWDAPPDAALLDAVAAGELREPSGLARQVDRLIASPRFEQGVRSFFSDMFGFEHFAGLSKDQSIYPKFNSQLAKDSQEQMLRTIVAHLVTERGDYRDLFTTRKTFVNRNLGGLYKVAVDEQAVDGWAPYTFAASEPRAGILTLPGFLMLDPTHEGRSSPTSRGKAVRELFLCQPVPDPPPNVNFAAVQNTGDQVHRTARDRLTIHQENPACIGCHALTDPIGLSLENYDAVGSFRTHENGAPIDAGGRYLDHDYTGAIGLQRLIREDPSAPLCATQRAFEYGVGRTPTASEETWLEHAAQGFAADRHQFPALLRRIAISPAFRALAVEQAAPTNPLVATR